MYNRWHETLVKTKDNKPAQKTGGKVGAMMLMSLTKC